MPQVSEQSLFLFFSSPRRFLRLRHDVRPPPPGERDLQAVPRGGRERLPDGGVAGIGMESFVVVVVVAAVTCHTYRKSF